MKKNENNRVCCRYAPEKNVGIALFDFLLVVAGFLATAIFLKGNWQLNLTEMAVVLLEAGFAVLFFWGFEMYSAILLKPYPIIVTAVLSAIYSVICTFLVMLPLPAERRFCCSWPWEMHWASLFSLFGTLRSTIIIRSGPSAPEC